MRKCSIETCKESARKRGWCHKHYQRWRVHGDPSIKLKTGPKNPQTLVQPGQVFGRLTVMERVENLASDADNMWLCRCECGGTAITRSQSLRTGHTRSCGCLMRDVWRGVVPRAPTEEQKRRHYKYTYGLSLEEAEALLAKGCAICGSDRNAALRLCIDHCHVTGKTRGALCVKCNSLLGMADDSIERLEAAAVYLERARSR